jgi:16S rRNA (cytidine1402-2'-O)-methyltransferase
MGYTAALHANTNISQWYIKSAMPGPTAATRGGTLYVVATPIGNLEDITLRALRILKSVSLVAAEDTRRTAILLRHYEIQAPLLSVHEHNEGFRVETLVARLAAGESVALVTDAGTPAVADPGAQLVAAVRRAGIRVEPIPGPSAVLAALSASGLSTEGFSFLGFPPSRPKARKQWFASLADEVAQRAVVLFESPHRLDSTLEALSILGEHQIMAWREVTKIHEEAKSGTPAELRRYFSRPKGEFTLVVPRVESTSTVGKEPSDDQIALEFGQITATGEYGSRREAVRRTADKLAMSVKAVYQSLERSKIG